MENSKNLEPEDSARALENTSSWKRLWLLVLFAVVALAAETHFVAIADSPLYQVHSDDVIWLYRYKHLPRPVDPEDTYDYITSIDQPALARWVFHVVLTATGRIPETLPPEWDFSQDFDWNVANGRIGPANTVYLVRVVNAVFMIAAAVFIYAALAKSVSALAGLAGGFFFIVHPATIEVLWSIGSDPLLWMLMTLALLLWSHMKISVRSAVIIGLVAGLATSAKLNGASVAGVYCLWLLAKRRWRLALLSVAVAFGVFVLANPVLFGKGLFGVHSVLADTMRRRFAQAAGLASHFPAYADAARWRVFWYLLGRWWPLLPLVLVSRRMWKLEPVVFWGAGLAVLHCLTVTAPEERYLYPLQTGLVVGTIAAYWPKRTYLVRAVARGVSLLRRSAQK